MNGFQIQQQLASNSCRVRNVVMCSQQFRRSTVRNPSISQMQALRSFATTNWAMSCGSRLQVVVHAKSRDAKNQTDKQPKEVAEDEQDEVIDLDDDFDSLEYEVYDDDGQYIEDDEFEEEDDGDDDGLRAVGIEADESTGPGVDTGGSHWAEVSLKATQKVLSLPVMDNVELYVFRALPGKKLDIRLDRLDDTYGSPSIDDIEKFSRSLFLELEAELGTEAAGDISLEVSSPGAERTLRIPQDLNRFKGLPLYVEYSQEDGTTKTSVMVMDVLDEDNATTSWKLADVRANAPAKGRKLSKRQREIAINVPVPSLKLVRVHVDF